MAPRMKGPQDQTLQLVPSQPLLALGLSLVSKWVEAVTE